MSKIVHLNKCFDNSYDVILVFALIVIIHVIV